MLLICFRDLEWPIVSQHPHHFSQVSHLLQDAHRPVLIWTCIDNWFGVSYTWHIPEWTSLLQLDLSLDSPKIHMRVIRTQQSTFFDIFMELPSLVFYTLLILLNWKVSLTLIQLVPLMIWSLHQVSFTSLVKHLLLVHVRNSWQLHCLLLRLSIVLLSLLVKKSHGFDSYWWSLGFRRNIQPLFGVITKVLSTYLEIWSSVSGLNILRSTCTLSDNWSKMVF